MNTQNTIKSFLTRVQKDERILPTHLSLFMALTMYVNENNTQGWFRVCRRKLMEFSKLKSRSTYHKCLRNLVEFGYIYYEPSYDPILASRVMFIFD